MKSIVLHGQAKGAVPNDDRFRFHPNAVDDGSCGRQGAAQRFVIDSFQLDQVFSFIQMDCTDQIIPKGSMLGPFRHGEGNVLILERFAVDRDFIDVRRQGHVAEFSRQTYIQNGVGFPVAGQVEFQAVLV